MEKVIVCDLDGCLNDYPKCFVEWVNEKYSMKYATIRNMKQGLASDDYDDIKLAYRMSGVKRSLPIRDGANNALHRLKADGWTVKVVTSRPVIEPVKGDTIYWLQKLNITSVSFVDDKYEYIKNSDDYIKFVIDDNEEFCKKVADLGFKVLLFGSMINYSNITSVNSWADVEKVINCSERY